MSRPRYKTKLHTVCKLLKEASNYYAQNKDMPYTLSGWQLSEMFSKILTEAEK